jgi:hypothetical protein
MAEPAKVFNNVILGQFVLSGVPIKVYASGRFLTLTSTDDIEDPTIGFGMDEDGEMIQFSYPEVEFIQIHGNKVDIITYNKGMAALHGGDEAPADAEAAEEEPKKEESVSMKLKDLIKENFLGDLPSSKLMKMKWNPLSEISKDEYKAQEKALKGEMDAKKAGMKAAKDKLSALKKQPIEDGMIPEAVYIDIAHAVKAIKNYNRTEFGTGPEGLYDLTMDILTNIGFKPSTKNVQAAVDHLRNSMKGDKVPEDGQMVKELYPLLEDTLNEQANPFDEYVKFYQKNPEGKDPYHEELVDLVQGMAFNAYDALASSVPVKDTDEMMEWIYSLSDGEAMAMTRRIKKGDFGLYENDITEYTFGTGDIIHDRDPACPHFGSKGIVITSTPEEVRYTVTNGGTGDQYKPGDILSKEPQQLEVYK